jgi:L-galactose dehydrogenase
LKALCYIADRVTTDVVLSYCHYALNDTALADHLAFFQSKSIAVINASPLSMGLLSARGAPDWHPAPAVVRRACADAAALCQSRGTSIESLAIQFAVANPAIPTTLVGTADPQEIQANVDCLKHPLDPSLLCEIQSILQPVHNLTWPSGRPENN